MGAAADGRYPRQRRLGDRRAEPRSARFAEQVQELTAGDPVAVHPLDRRAGQAGRLGLGNRAAIGKSTGEAIRAPALNPLARWTVERRNGMVFVRGELASPVRSGAALDRTAGGAVPSSIIIDTRSS